MTQVSVSRDFLIRLKLSPTRQYRIAQEAGVCPGTLSSLLSGARRVKAFDHRIVAVGRVLGLEPDECFSRTREEGEENHCTKC